MVVNQAMEIIRVHHLVRHGSKSDSGSLGGGGSSTNVVQYSYLENSDLLSDLTSDLSYDEVV